MITLICLAATFSAVAKQANKDSNDECFSMSKYDVQNLRVRLGDHNIRENGYQDGATVDKKVRRVIRHKGFSSSTLVR